MLKRISELVESFVDAFEDFYDRHEIGVTIAIGIYVLVMLIVLLLNFIGLAVGITGNATPSSEITWEGDLQMSDTRIVHCVATNDGLSCDWKHVSGADQ